MYTASFVLRQLFVLVAQAQSTETFVALCLLVAAGMGSIAKFFGLTDTAGAFAAGVLLANTNYRSQIQADVSPFKGILLGIFFMDAGSTFDSELVLSQWPTIVVSATGLILLKALTLGAATRVPRWMEPNRLTPSDAVRVALMLSGGGEFAFVVLASAQKLSVIPGDLSAILTAIILITMGVTPLLGQIASVASEPFVGLMEEDHALASKAANGNGNAYTLNELRPVADDAVVVCGYGEIGRSLVQILSEHTLQRKRQTFHDLNGTTNPSQNYDPIRVVAFCTSRILLNNMQPPTLTPNCTKTIYGNGASAEIIRSAGRTNPSAIFIAYDDHRSSLTASLRLRNSFPDTPIYARAATRVEEQSLLTAGATQVVVEADDLPRAAPSLLKGVWRGNLVSNSSKEEKQTRIRVAQAAGLSTGVADELLELFKGIDQDGSGFVSIEELENVLVRTTNWIASDEEITEFNAWIEVSLKGLEPLDAVEFCRLYGRAPEFVKKAFGVSVEYSETDVGFSQ